MNRRRPPGSDGLLVCHFSLFAFWDVLHMVKLKYTQMGRSLRSVCSNSQLIGNMCLIYRAEMFTSVFWMDVLSQ